MSALREHMEAWGKGMQASLKVARLSFKHGGNRGHAAEEALRDFLRRVVPASRTVGHGEIIDTHGNRSGQIDVAVTHPFHPLLVPLDRAGLLLIEGTAAVGEVKTCIQSADDVTEVLRKGERLRTLRAELPDGTLVRASPSALRTFVPEVPPFFLFAFKSKLTLEAIHKLVVGAPRRTLDAVFVLDRGSLIDHGDGMGKLRFIAEDTKQSLPGWQKVERKIILPDLLLWLSATMLDLEPTESILPQYLARTVIRDDGSPAR